MQPGRKGAQSTEDLHGILSRFQSWVGSDSANPDTKNGSDAGIREIPYEEALRQIRSRRAPQAKIPSPAAELPDNPAAAAAFARSAAWLSASPEQQPQQQSAATAITTAAVAQENNPPPVAGTARIKTVRIAKPPALQKADNPSASRKAQSPPVTKEVKSAALAAASTRSDGGKKRPACKAPAPAVSAAQALPEFRAMMVKSVRRAKASGAPARRSKPERELRVSVRLTDAEERQLQACAAREGMTVSAYLRRCALQPQSEPPAIPAKQQKPAPILQERAAPAPTNANGPKPAKSSLGDWLTVLRNRFLASPARFAERA